MRRRTHRQLGFQHTADHAFHTVHLGQAADLQRLPNAAGLHQLDVEQVGRTGADDLGCIFGRKHAFIRKNRRIYSFCDGAHAVQVVRGHRLLHKVDVQPFIFHRGDDTNGFLCRPALVCIHTNLDAAAYGLADACDARHVGQALFADFDFKYLISLLHRLKAVRHHLRNRIYADGDIRFHRVPSASQKLVQRRAEALGIQIIHCHIHRSLGGSVFHNAGMQPVHNAVQIFDLHAKQGGTDKILDGTADASLGIPGDNRRGRRLAIPCGPGVGCDTHHDILYIFYRTKRRFKGLCQRNEYLSDFNFCDFHIIVLFLLSEHFSTLQRL